MTKPKSEIVLTRDPASSGLPLWNHSTRRLGSPTGISLHSKWAKPFSGSSKSPGVLKNSGALPVSLSNACAWISIEFQSPSISKQSTKMHVSTWHSRDLLGAFRDLPTRRSSRWYVPFLWAAEIRKWRCACPGTPVKPKWRLLRTRWWHGTNTLRNLLGRWVKFRGWRSRNRRTFGCVTPSSEVYRWRTIRPWSITKLSIRVRINIKMPWLMIPVV